MFWNKTSRSLRTKLLDYLECGLSKSYSTSSNMLGIDLWRGRRCCSCNLQLPPLSHRQSERAKTPDRDILSRPTTLPLLTPPRIMYENIPGQLSKPRMKEECGLKSQSCSLLIFRKGRLTTGDVHNELYRYTRDVRSLSQS
uniref:Uncharacterized protein n=1 Tax=Gopherus evgoodei TaxID=1825980 RepID=A0A8C4VZG0_9SAUR